MSFAEDIESYMNEYNHEYEMYKQEWDLHYQNLRTTIKKYLTHSGKFALIGCGSMVNELDSEILSRIDSLTLIDVLPQLLNHAEEKLKKLHPNVSRMEMDITNGLASYFASNLDSALNSPDPKKALRSIALSPRNPAFSDKFDFLVQSMVLDFFAYPAYWNAIKRIESGMDKGLITLVQKAMLKFNHAAALTATKAMRSMCSDSGTFILFTNVARNPPVSEGSEATRTVYFQKPVRWYAKEAGFEVIEEITTEWKDMPSGDDAHSHDVLHLICKAK